MTPLRRRMTEDMQVRNFSPHTQNSYAQQVSLFARHFSKSPEVLGPEEIRSYSPRSPAFLKLRREKYCGEAGSMAPGPSGRTLKHSIFSRCVHSASADCLHGLSE